MCVTNTWRPFFAARRNERMPQHPFKYRMRWEWHWEFPLRTDSASWKSLESLMQFISFCSSCTLPGNSKIVLWSSMNFRLAIMSKVELWNFRNSFISVRLCWQASRNSNICRHSCPCRCRHSSSAWAAWSSWWPTFSRYSAMIVCLCSSSRVLICEFELLRSSIRVQWSIVSVLNSFVFRKSAVSLNYVSCDIRLLWSIDHAFSIRLCPDPSNITDDDWLTDWLASWYAVVDFSLVCRSEHLAECQVIHALVRGRYHEGEGDWWVVELVEGKELGLITCGMWRRSEYPRSLLQRSNASCLPCTSCWRAQGTARGGRGRRGRTGRRDRRKGRRRIKEMRPWICSWVTMWMRSELEPCHEVCVSHHELWNEDARIISVHVRHASVKVQVRCVNVVIGVVLGELHVVRVVPIVVCDDAAIRRTLVLIAIYRSHGFSCKISVAIFCIRK